MDKVKEVTIFDKENATKKVKKIIHFDDIQNNLSYDKNIKDENKLMNTDNSNKNKNEQSTKISMHRSQSLNYSNSFLLPLVIRRNEKIKMKKESRKN